MNRIKNRLKQLVRPFGTIAIIFACVSLVAPVYLHCQAEASEDPEFVNLQEKVSPVKVDGRVLFYVAGITSHSSDLRASLIGERIEKIASDTSISSDSLKIIPGETRFQIFAGKEFIMNLYEADALEENIKLNSLAEIYVLKIDYAIDSYRNDRSKPVLIRKSLYAIGAGLLLIAILFLLLWLLRRLQTFLFNRFKTRIDSVENKSFNLIRSHQLWRGIQIFFKTIRIIIVVLIVSAFLQYILGLFPWTNNIATYTLQLFLNPVIKIWKGFIGFIPSLVFLFVIFLVTRYFLRLINLLFAGIGQGAIVINGFDAEWAIPTFRILRFFIIAFALVVAYPYIPGSESMAFKGVSVFLGVLFSLGSSSFISNVVAGYSMTYRGAFKMGDLIKIDDHFGYVVEQKLLVTRLRSPKNEEIVIPNSLMLNTNIINYSKRASDPGLILHTIVGIGYETPWRQVEAMLVEAADRTEGLLKQPPPFVLQKSLGDFAVNYEINAYCNDVPRLQRIYTNLHQNILDVFNENNVQIMTPAYEGDPEIPKVVPKDQWFTPLAGKG